MDNGHVDDSCQSSEIGSDHIYNRFAVGYHFVFIFFFQAEDGIRDTSVTGVQTCALPISGTAYGKS